MYRALLSETVKEKFGDDEVRSNLNGVAAVNAATDNDGIDNTKFQSSTEAPLSTAPVVISKKVVLNEEEITTEIHAEFASNEIWNARIRLEI